MRQNIISRIVSFWYNIINLASVFSNIPKPHNLIFLSRRSRIVTTNLLKNNLQRKSASMKVCLHTMQKLQAFNHLLEDVCRKENTLFQKRLWQKKSYQRTLFQEAVSGTLAKYKMEHFLTILDSLQTLATVAKSSIFTYGRSSETTSGYKNNWGQRSLNYELYPEVATGGVL